MTSGGIYQRGAEPPFDLQRERREPTWGDPSYRVLPSDVDPADVDVSHLHLNPADMIADFNIQLPITRFKELVAAGKIRALASQVYSFMGYQGYPPDTSEWQQVYGPQVAEKFKAENVDSVLLTAA